MKSKDYIDNEVLENAVGHFSSRNSQVSFVGGHQNLVYEYRQDEKSFILRLTPSTNRSENLVQSELDWISFLANKGVSVSKPILSKKG
nr:phosphotransferase [Paenibacillus cymbidii]